MKSLFNNEDENKVNELNKIYYSHNPTQQPPQNINPLTQELNKYINNKQFNKYELTPISFAYLASTYFERAKKAEEIIQVPRGVIRGNALEIKKQRTCTINDFAQEIGISMRQLNELKKLNDYKQTIEMLSDGLSSEILSQVMKGSIKESVGKMYLINFTEMKDVSHIEHINTEKVLPSFMNKNIAKEIRQIDISTND